MTLNTIDTVLNKCDIYYGDALISKENLLKQYAMFLNELITTSDHNVSFALHTGSLCFDIVSFVLFAIGGLTYNLNSNDDILASLMVGDMVMYSNERHRWLDTTERDGTLYIILEQDGKGRNGKLTRFLPYENNKHLIRPYYGASAKTDGRGIRRRKTHREEFLSLICGIPESEVPVEVNTSVVIVTERAEFADVCKKLRIVYGPGKEIGILDIAPACYYTSSGTAIQFGTNLTKAEAVLKVTNRIGTARELELDKSGNTSVGLLISGLTSLIDGGTELADLLRRKSLQFVHITAPLCADLSENILDLTDDASVFACTKDFLISNAGTISSQNPLTYELYCQISNVVDNKVLSISIAGGMNWEDYKQIRTWLSILKQSSWQNDRKEEFILSAYALLNLLTTAPFSMDFLNDTIASGVVHSAVQAPFARIENLRSMADTAGLVSELCHQIVDELELQYYETKVECPKAMYLQRYIAEHKGKKIAVVIPKAYYADIIRCMIWFDELPEPKPVLVSVNRFCVTDRYDYILAVGDFSSKKFNAFQCYSAREIDVLLYDCEAKTFRHKRQKADLLSQRLNRRINKQIDYQYEESRTDVESVTEIETTIAEFAAFDLYVENIGAFDIKQFVSNAIDIGGRSILSEVRYVGVFTTGEQILFSKYYSPIVFDSNAGTVVETSVEKLSSGDLLVFTKRDDYTKNIVDYIYDQLMSLHRLNNQISDATEKAFYWKEALREYKEKHNYTFQTITQKLKEQGSSLSVMAVRQWLTEDGHIVGPRKEESFYHIAQVTQDPYLLADPSAYFRACQVVRHERGEILKLIAKAINDKLSGHMPVSGSVLEVVYDNVENLSEILEIDSISCLDETINVPINIVNRPITESEVQL